MKRLTWKDSAAAFFIWICLILMWPGSYLMQSCGQCYGCGAQATPTPTATATGVATATATATASPTATATTTPKACATITPPALSNPQTFVAGASFGGHTVNGDGVTDDSAALQAALNIGDVSVSAGTYWINPNAVQLNYSNGRNIRCPTPGATPAATFVNTSRTGNNYMLTVHGGTNSIFYCGFHGPNYNLNVQEPNDSFSQYFVGLYGGSTTLVQNDFNGNAGYLAAVYGTSDNNNVSCNTFEDCGLYAIQTGRGNNWIIANNTMLDCTQSIECDFGCPSGCAIQSCSYTCSGIITNNHLTFVHGVRSVPVNGVYSGLGTGDSPGGSNYSGWTESNNIVDGTCQSWFEPAGSCGTIPPVLSGNQCNPACQTSTRSRTFCP